MRDIIGQLSYYKYQIKVINDSLQQLLNQTRQLALSGLNLTSSISIDHGDCFTERLECAASGVINLSNLNPRLGIDIGQCTTDYTSYANEVCCTAVHIYFSIPIHTDTYSGWCLM